MIDFSLFTSENTVTMTDFMVTVSAVMAGLVAYRQKAKDTQLAARDETIKFLRDQLEHENKVNEILHEKILQMIENMNGGIKHGTAP